MVEVGDGHAHTLPTNGGSAGRTAPLPCTLVEGYDETTYGEAFADVYDEWYQGVSDVDTTVSRLAELTELVPPSDGRRRQVLELGVGTGRIAVPLAAIHRDRIDVVGVDASRPMLDRLAARDGGDLVETHLADMVTGLPDGPFDVAVIAYNTLFNLTGDGEQQRCFTEVAGRLRPGGRFVIEAFVPDPAFDGDDVSIRSMSADKIVLSVSRHDAPAGRADGHFVELTEAGGVRLRPWSIRYASPGELDDLAMTAGFELEHRWADMAGSPFDDDSARHVSVYRLR